MAFQVRDLMASVLPSTSEDGAYCVSCVSTSGYCPSCGLTLKVKDEVSTDLSELQEQLRQQLGELLS